MASSNRSAKRTGNHVERTLVRPTESGPLIRRMTRVTPVGPRPPRILWIPGLGGDRVMFAPLIARLDQTVRPAPLHSFLEYPDVMPGEVDSLESLAALLAQGILPEEPYDMVIGCSMGGMMLQILRMKGWLQARRCVLLSTGFSGKDLTPLIHAASFFPAPANVLRPASQAITAALYPFFRLGIPTARDLGRMFGRFPRTIFFEGPRWIREWKGVPAPFYDDSILIHGTNDPLMSYKRISAQKTADLAIDGGSHILFATHAQEIAAFLAPFLSQDATERASRQTTTPKRQRAAKKKATRTQTKKKKVRIGR